MHYGFPPCPLSRGGCSLPLLESFHRCCRDPVEAVRRAGNLDSDKLHEVLLALKTKTVLGDFAVDERGFQVGHKAITIQWQDGKQVVVWPDELASGKPRFPTPPWSERLTSK